MYDLCWMSVRGQIEREAVAMNKVVKVSSSDHQLHLNKRAGWV